MYLFGNKTRLDDAETQKLIVAIKKLNGANCGIRNKQALKAHLFEKINSSGKPAVCPFSLAKMIERIRKISAKVFLPATESALLKERVLAGAARLSGESESSVYGRFFRPAMSILLLVVFSLTTFMAFPMKIPVAFASNTYLNDIRGDVLVMRDGHIFEGQENLSLMPGDTVTTMKNSYATVHFFDDSIGRLNENSGLEIKVLYTDPGNPLVTQVRLMLKEGRLWGRVMNLIDERAVFSVETPEIKATVVKKASFDLYTNDQITKIAVFDNAVDLVAANSKDNAPSKTVIAGYQAEINNAASGGYNLKLISDEDPEVVSSKKWVVANIAEDEKYKQTIADDVKVEVLNPENVLSKIPVFTDENLEKQKQDFLDRYHDLITAETMLVRGNHKEGIKYIHQFKQGIQTITEALPAFAEKDQVTADALRQMMNEYVDVQMKDMAGFVPGDDLYPVKIVLEEAALLLATDDIGRTSLKFSSSAGRLLEMQALIKDGKLDYAKNVLKNYRDGTEQFILKINSGNEVELQDKLLDMIKQQIQQIKVLVAIEQSMTGEDSSGLKNEIKTFGKEIMLKLVNAIDQLDREIPTELLTELKDLYMTYYADDTDIDTVMAIFDKMIKPSSGLNFIQPDQTNIPNELGVVVIVEEEATPNAVISDASDIGNSQQAEN
jgi:hypothetical protein